MKNAIKTLLISSCLLAGGLSAASASIIGLYYPSSTDKVSVALKDGRPVLRIEAASWIDLPQCAGFQLYRRTPPQPGNVELMSGEKGKGTGFGLWEPKACLDAYYANPDGAGRRKLVQEIDVYQEFFAAYATNKDELIRGFEAGEFFLAVLHQVNADGYESRMNEVYFTYRDAVEGKVIIGR